MKKRISEPRQIEHGSSSNHVPLFDEASLACDAIFVSIGLANAAERIPETKGFVSSSSNDHTAIRTHAKIEYTICVASQTDHLRHGRVFPDVDGMLRETVGRDEL